MQSGVTDDRELDLFGALGMDGVKAEEREEQVDFDTFSASAVSQDQAGVDSANQPLEMMEIWSMAAVLRSHPFGQPFGVRALALFFDECSAQLRCTLGAEVSRRFTAVLAGPWQELVDQTSISLGSKVPVHAALRGLPSTISG